MSPLLIVGIVLLVVGSFWSALDELYRIPERRDHGIRGQAILQLLLIVAGIVFIAIKAK